MLSEKHRIPYARQSIDEEDIAAVTAALRSDFLTQGPLTTRFEQALSQYCGARYAFAVTNATDALHLGCLALDIGADDIVWTTPISFVASANCARYCGARVDFVDINAADYNLDIDCLAEKLQWAKKNHCLPSLLIVVHFAGQPCHMREIYELSQSYGFKIMEDASHALGAEYTADKIGSCQYADLCVFSFHPVKMITTAEGGAILTNQVQLAEKIQRLKNAGISKDPQQFTETTHGNWYYQQLELGYNRRMNSLQAALGLSQLKKLDSFVAKRRQLVEAYRQLLDGLPLKLPLEHDNRRSSWHLYVIYLRDADRRKALYDYLHHHGVLVQVHYIPIHLQPYYRQLGFRPGDFPHAERYYQSVLSLPLYVDLKPSQQQYIAECIAKFFHHQSYPGC